MIHTEAYLHYEWHVLRPDVRLDGRQVASNRMNSFEGLYWHKIMVFAPPPIHPHAEGLAIEAFDIPTFLWLPKKLRI